MSAPNEPIREVIIQRDDGRPTKSWTWAEPMRYVNAHDLRSVLNHMCAFKPLAEGDTNRMARISFDDVVKEMDIRQPEHLSSASRRLTFVSATTTVGGGGNTVVSIDRSVLDAVPLFGKVAPMRKM